MLPTTTNHRMFREANKNKAVAHTHYDLSPLYDDGIHRALISLSHQTEYVSFTPNLSAFLPSIEDKIGGMPYLDIADEWPQCQNGSCQQRMRFKFQITTDLNRHNLLCFYTCDRCFNQNLNPETWLLKAYQVNSMQRYGGNGCGRIDLKSYKGNTQKSYSLPQWQALPRHDIDLQSAFKMMEPSAPEALYRYFTHHHQVEVNIDAIDLVIGGYPRCENRLNHQLFINPAIRFIAQINRCSKLFNQNFCGEDQQLIIFCRNSKFEIALNHHARL